MKKELTAGILGIILFFLNINSLWADIPNEPVLTVTPVFQTVSSNAGTASLSVSNTGTGTMAWTAEAVSTPDWLTITAGAGGSDAGTITCAYDDNAETAPRTTIIRVSAADAANSPIYVMVAQAADGNATIKSFAWFEVLKVVSGQAFDMDADFYGDIDGDGKTSVKEAIYALQSVSQIREPSEARAILEVQGPDITKTVQAGTQEIISEQYILKNTGELPLDWEIGFIQDSAISVSTHSGTLAKNETTAIAVSIDTSKLSQGNYRNTLFFINFYDVGPLAEYSSGTTTRQVNVQIQKQTTSSCGAYVAPGVWKQFDCYNLAAIGKTTKDDPFTPSWRLIGGYWQWGRKGPDSSQWYDTNTANFAHGPTGPDSGDANGGTISSSDTNWAPNGAWSDTIKTANDPCPEGYRVPTRTQWDGVRGNNTQSVTGSWASSATNYSSARFFGNDLMLSTAGNRSGYSSSLSSRGGLGDYWSSTQYSSNYAWYLHFSRSNVSTGNYTYRRYGFSVRCVAE